MFPSSVLIGIQRDHVRMCFGKRSRETMFI